MDAIYSGYSNADHPCAICQSCLAKTRWLIAITLIALSMLARPVVAQSPVTMAMPTVVVPEDLNIAVITILTDHPIDGAAYYGITDYTLKSNIYIVSLAALGPATDPNSWSIEAALWLGTVAIDQTTWIGAMEGTPEYQAMTADIFFRPLPTPLPSFGVAPEGGEDGENYWGRLIPLKIGTNFLYGVRGIHAAGYGTTGWYAVDLVTGSDLGSNFAPNAVYGAEDGTVTYVCRDSYSVAVKTSQVIYAHLVDNASLQTGLVINRGAQFATMRSGTFSSTCGWAEQQPNHYHLHWAVNAGGQPKIFIGSNFYGVIATNKIEAITSGETFNPGDTLTNLYLTDNNIGTDPNIMFTGDNLWDGIVGSVINFINTKIISRYPTGQDWEAGATFVSSTGSIMKVVFILMSSNFKLEIFAFVVIIILIMEPARTIFRMWKIVRKLIPGL